MNSVDRDAFRQVIREVLAEELGRLKAETGAFAATAPRPQVREETVAISSSADLMAFAHRLLEIGKDGRSRQEIEAGRWVFQLAGGGGAGSGTSTSGAHSAQETARFDHGLVSERQIEAIRGSNRVVLGKRARLTPLARDRIRQCGIKIERVG